MPMMIGFMAALEKLELLDELCFGWDKERHRLEDLYDMGLYE